MPAPTPNPWVASLDPYVPGRAKAAGVARPVKLSANEAALGPSPAAVEACREAAGSLHVYPDGGAVALREAIGRAHGLDPARIVCGAGSDDLLNLVCLAYARPGDVVIHSRLGFMMYPVIARGAGCTPVAVPNVDFKADVDGILAAVTEKTRVVYLDNPNNPTGRYLTADEIGRLHAGLPGHVVLVLDGAYAECVDARDYDAGAALVDGADNVVMTRTFSKLYGLASLRIGWCYGPPAIVDALNRMRMPFNATGPSQAAAIAALADTAHLDTARAHNSHWRAWLTEELTAAGLEVVPSQTNFVLIRFPDAPDRSAGQADAYLTDRGLLLRRLTVPGLERCLRLTIGTERHNRDVVAALRAFMGSPAHV